MSQLTDKEVHDMCDNLDTLIAENKELTADYKEAVQATHILEKINAELEVDDLLAELETLTERDKIMYDLIKSISEDDMAFWQHVAKNTLKQIDGLSYEKEK